MRPQRAMVGRASSAQSSRPPLAVLEARAAEQSRVRVRELEEMVEAQAAEITELRAQLDGALVSGGPTANSSPSPGEAPAAQRRPSKKRRKRT